MKIIRFTFCCLLLILPFALNARVKRDQETLESARSFVREFYDWYVLKVSENKSGAAWNSLLKRGKAVFEL